jgi:hypothetical protein
MLQPGPVNGEVRSQRIEHLCAGLENMHAFTIGGDSLPLRGPPSLGGGADPGEKAMEPGG